VTFLLSWRNQNNVTLIGGLSLQVIFWVSRLPKLKGLFFSLSRELVKFFTNYVSSKFSCFFFWWTCLFSATLPEDVNWSSCRNVEQFSEYGTPENPRWFLSRRYNTRKDVRTLYGRKGRVKVECYCANLRVTI